MAGVRASPLSTARAWGTATSTRKAAQTSDRRAGPYPSSECKDEIRLWEAIFTVHIPFYAGGSISERLVFARYLKLITRDNRRSYRSSIEKTRGFNEPCGAYPRSAPHGVAG